MLKTVAVLRNCRQEIRKTFPVSFPSVVFVFVAAAAPLIEQIDTKPFRGGYKRRRVEAQLFRLYPADAKTDIALAVEVAIRRMRGL